MEDHEIVALYWDRDERAIGESEQKYGALCRGVALRVLENIEDSEECVSDTWLRSWNTIPPQRPNLLGAFLARITRNLALDRWRAARAEKRGGGETALALEELEDCVPSGASGPEEHLEASELAALIARFLRAQPEESRRVFLRRYWYVESVSAIAEAFGFSESKVKSMLFRTRKGLRRFLEKEGYL